MKLLGNKTLRKNILLMSSLVLIPVIILNVYHFYYWSGYIKADEFEKDTKFLSLAGQTFDTILNDITQVISIMEFDQLLTSAIDGLVENNGELSPSKFIYLNTVWDNTSRTLMAKPYIRSAYFYIEKAGNLVFTTEGIRNIQDQQDISWLNSYKNQSDDIIYWTELRKIEVPIPSNSSIEVISLFRKFPFLHGQGESNGVIVVNLESKYFDSIVSKIPGIKAKKLYILDDKHNTIYQNCSDSINAYVNIENITDLKESSNKILKVKNEEYLVSTVKSKNFDWVYISIISTNSLLSKLDFMTKVSVIVFLISLVISIILSILYTLKNYKPVKTMINIITQYNNGYNISNFKFEKNDDYEYIIYNIIKNFIDKNEIQKKLAEEKLLQNETQLYALQTQINPHFLYNTLETLNWEALNLLGRDNTISEILIHLSSSLRYATNFSKSLVTIEEDINQLKNYVYMLELLNQDRMKFIFNIDNAIMCCKTLKLLIQPLVENAVIHGLSNKADNGRVKVSIRDKSSDIEVTVIDNGCGMPKYKLLELCQALSSTDLFASKSLGLRNINQRIKIKFGEQYGMRLRSKANFGTAVYIRFPKIQ